MIIISKHGIIKKSIMIFGSGSNNIGAVNTSHQVTKPKLVTYFNTTVEQTAESHTRNVPHKIITY